MNWQEDIPTFRDGKCAQYSAQLCNSESDIDALFHFSFNAWGFVFYRSQIPVSAIWPMAVLLYVEVPFQYRRKGIGTAAIQRFFEAARERGALLGFLRVGWVGEISVRDNLVSWYQRRGWHLLSYPADHFIVPFMYRVL